MKYDCQNEKLNELQEKTADIRRHLECTLTREGLSDEDKDQDAKLVALASNALQRYEYAALYQDELAEVTLLDELYTATLSLVEHRTKIGEYVKTDVVNDAYEGAFLTFLAKLQKGLTPEQFRLVADEMLTEFEAQPGVAHPALERTRQMVLDLVRAAAKPPKETG